MYGGAISLAKLIEEGAEPTLQRDRVSNWSKIF